jgi:hypothetical protein
MSFVNPNTCHLICNNFNLNFVFGTVCLCVCVCAFSLHRESPDMILGDKPLISEVVLSQLALQCNSIVDACPHTLQVLTILSACTSCRRMMALT